MVRFIMIYLSRLLRNVDAIYIPLWLDLLFLFAQVQKVFYIYLHSTMVRFIISKDFIISCIMKKFTFHYGQIYYVDDTIERSQFLVIYIPLWLDLLFKNRFLRIHDERDLHSTMVRFIMSSRAIAFEELCEIYIPLWLDLLYNFER